MKPVRVALVGISGFAENHIMNLRRLCDLGKAELVAVCDIAYERLRGNLDAFGFESVPGYTDYERMLGEISANLVDIVTPIPFHAEMAEQALRAGYDVFMEKPPAVTIQDYNRLADAQRRYGRRVMLNFQMTSDFGFRALLDDIASGMIGDVRQVCGVGAWKRDIAYFTRSPWVGKLRFLERDTLDGVLMNPFAHLWNNCLILGTTAQDALLAVQAELYHVNAIEGDDLSCVRVTTDRGVTVVLAAATCCPSGGDTSIRVQGTEGSAHWRYSGAYTIWDRSGKVIREVHQPCDAHQVHYEAVIDHMAGLPVPILATLDNARNFVLATNLAFVSSAGVRTIPNDYRLCLTPDGQSDASPNDPTTFVCVRDVETALNTAAQSGQLFSEQALPWASAGFCVDARDFTYLNVEQLKR